MSRERRTTRTRSSESCRNTGQSRTTGRTVNEPILEECTDQEEYNEQDCGFEFPEQEPRYDPKELRDAAKILSPFLRLIEDTNNPYARIVTREVCKTFYHLFHPGLHPVDVIKSINWDVKTERTNQLWNEFWQYVPGARIKEWTSLKPNARRGLFDVSDDGGGGCDVGCGGPLEEPEELAVDEVEREGVCAGTVPPADRRAEGENRFPRQGICPARRHSAGNDNAYKLPFCPPGPSSFYPDLDSSWDYYRTIAMTSPPVIDALDDISFSTEDGVETANATDAPDNDATLLSNAFATLTLAEKDLQRKREAFDQLTQAHLESARKAATKNDPACPEDATAKQILQAIYQNPPMIMKPFDDCEWNDNAFRDRDFVRLLPFFEVFHNQLEHVSRKQREFGMDMLDDVMSVLYHIHYDLGDPRLKNDMLVAHVKLIAANTWETYFYQDGRRMPPIPEVPCPRSPPREEVEQPAVSSPRPTTPRPTTPRPITPARSITPKSGPSSRRSSVGAVPPPPMPPPKKKPPTSVKPAPNAPKHNRPSGHGVMSPKSESVAPAVKKRPTAAPKRRPQTSTSTRRPNDAPEATQDACPPPDGPKRQTNFLRRSKPMRLVKRAPKP